MSGNNKTLTVFLGPIAAGKTHVGKKYSAKEEARFIDFDRLVYLGSDAPRKNDIILYDLFHIIAFSTEKDFVIDGWFAWESEWWKKKPSLEDISLLQEFLADSQNITLEVNFVILEVSAGKIMQRIKADDEKYSYDDYESSVSDIYNFYDKCFSEAEGFVYEKWDLEELKSWE